MGIVSYIHYKLQFKACRIWWKREVVIPRLLHGLRRRRATALPPLGRGWVVDALSVFQEKINLMNQGYITKSQPDCSRNVIDYTFGSVLETLVSHRLASKMVVSAFHFALSGVLCLVLHIPRHNLPRFVAQALCIGQHYWECIMAWPLMICPHFKSRGQS